MQCTDDTLKEADVLAQNELWRGCANRLYYAAFYAVTALLIQNNEYSKTHSGIKNLFNQHFIKTNILTSKESYLYSQLFDKRQGGDYSTLQDWTKDDILPKVQPTKEFVEIVRNLIKEN